MSETSVFSTTIPEGMSSGEIRDRIMRGSLDLYERLFGYGEKPRRYIEMELRDGVSEIAILYDLQTLGVTAFCIFYRRTLTELFIDYLGVSPDAQGRGLGGRLLNQVIEFSENMEGLREISLLCSLDKIPFYKRFGFRNTGEFTDISGTWFRLSRPR